MNAHDAKKLESMVVDIRETENLLLKRSRENLTILREILEGDDNLKRVPAVLSTFSIAGIIAGLFINAGINHGRLLSYHTETLTIYLKRLLGESPQKIQALAALRYQEAGLLFPWFDNRIAEIQTQLELFQEIQMKGVSPHLSFINKITETTRALSESSDGMAGALRSYVTDKAEQLFIWAVVDELEDCLDKYPESLERLRCAQLSAEEKMTFLMEEIKAFTEEEQLPTTATVTSFEDKCGSNLADKLLTSISDQVEHIEHMRGSTVRFDKSLQLMAKSLPPFIRTLSSLTIAWNKEASV